MLPTTLPLLLALLPLATPHFTLDSPPARGFNEDQLSQFPCGGVRLPRYPSPPHSTPLHPHPQLTPTAKLPRPPIPPPSPPLPHPTNHGPRHRRRASPPQPRQLPGLKLQPHPPPHDPRSRTREILPWRCGDGDDGDGGDQRGDERDGAGGYEWGWGRGVVQRALPNSHLGREMAETVVLQALWLILIVEGEDSAPT